MDQHSILPEVAQHRTLPEIVGMTRTFNRSLHIRENGTLLLSDFNTLFKLENEGSAQKNTLHPIAALDSSSSMKYFYGCSPVPILIHRGIVSMCEIEGTIVLIGKHTIARLHEKSGLEEVIWGSYAKTLPSKLEFVKAVGRRIYFTDSISVKVLENGMVHQITRTGNIEGERNEREGGPASDTSVYFTAGLDVSEELGKIWFVEEKRNVVRVLEAWFDVVS